MPIQTPELVEMPELHAVTVRGDVAPDDLTDFFGRAFTLAAAAAATAGVEIVGPPFGFYPTMPTDTVVVEAGFPVSGPPAGDLGEAHALVLPGGRAVQVLHIGSYDEMGQVYAALESWMREHDLQPAAGALESYLTDPGTVPDPRMWQTMISWPVA